MLLSPLRTAMLAGALSFLVLAAGPIAAASAEVDSSRITSPASPTYALYNETLPSPQHAFTVTGTTTGSGNITLRCYYGAGTNSYSTIVNEVIPSGNTFSVVVEAEDLRDGPCVLRAVPVGNTEAHPPGTASQEAGDPFQGPRIVGSRFEIYNEFTTNYDYEFEPNSLSGNFEIESVGDCGLDYSKLFAPNSLAESDHLFYCNAVLFQENDPPSGSRTRSELQIDGANAYSPATAYYLERNLFSAQIPGAPQITVTQTFDEKTGLITIHEIDPMVECSPQPTVFPPTTSSCSKYVSTGVQLERNWQTSNADQVAQITDNWSSTDGAPHALNALYDQEMQNPGPEGSAYEFPGSSVFSAVNKEQLVALPAGAGSIYYKEDSATPGSGDSQHPQGAIVYDRQPSEPLAFYRGTTESSYNGFEMPYQGTIPASGAYTLRMTFIQTYALSETEALASEALASYHPTLAISAPANGTTVSTPSVTVSGIASDGGGAPALTVAGHAVSVGAGGAWSTTVALNKGANTITAVATNQAGLSTEKSVSVTYTPPAPPVAKASQVGSASGAKGEVTFTIACTGSAGTSCEVESALSTVEKTRNGKPVAVAAKHHPKTHSKQVSVGSSKLTIPAGQKVTIAIKLNSAGKSLLARFGHLPVHLTAVLISAGHRSTVIAENITVKPAHKPKHKKHHGHRHGH